uniref:Uncharacterized protein n=1 Tax=Pararge aegeria TaxID=116150 RepID=S4P258_9NEOP
MLHKQSTQFSLAILHMHFFSYFEVLFLVFSRSPFYTQRRGIVQNNYTLSVVFRKFLISTLLTLIFRDHNIYVLSMYITI